MARRRKASDDVYNARRRFAREAQRYEKKASQASGMEAERYRTLARTSLEKSIALYDDPKKISGNSTIRNLTQKLNPRILSGKISDAGKKSLQRQSLRSLEGSKADEQARREYEAETIMSSDAGARIYAGLVSIWEDSDYADRDAAILDYFDADSMADVLDMIEESGINLYEDADELYAYEDIRTSIELAFAA